jgi:hypothetical protein
VNLTAKTKERLINIACETNAGFSDQSIISLVQLNTESRVQRGENAGKILHYVNVVKDFRTVDLQSSTGNVNFILPQIATDNLRVIAFTQNKESIKISAAAKAALE